MTLVTCASLLAPAVALGQGQAATPSQRTRLLRADRALADSAHARGLAAALAAVASPDVVLLYPDGPVVQGASSVERYLRAQPVLDTVRFSWRPIGIELSHDSSLAATWGVGVVTSRGGRVEMGQYLVVWGRGTRGEGRETGDEKQARDDWKVEAILIPDLAHPSGTVQVDGFLAELPALTAGRATAPFVGADTDFAKLAGDSGAAVAFARFAAPDAQMASGSGVIMIGPERIGRLVSGPNTWRWYAVAAGAAEDGSLGWTVGQAVISTPAGRNNASKYVTVWRSTTVGVRFVTDGGNGRPAGRP